MHAVDPVTTNRLSRGNYYMIINKASEQALKVQQTDPFRHQSSKIVGAKINAQDNLQIFMVELIDNQNQYEIVCCISDYVLEANNNKQVTLQNGKMAKNQVFMLVPIPDYPGQKLHKYYCIRCYNKQEYALSLQGNLRVSSYDPNSAAQQFRLEEVNNYTLQNSCLLINNYSEKALDVPQATDKHGQRIVIWDKNKRWNQRWFFQKCGTLYLIKSIINGLYLDIAGESRQNGAKVVQWPKTGGTNQLWHVEQAGNMIYKIYSAHAPALCLAIRKQEGTSGSYLQVCGNENPTMYWRIQGGHPK